MLRRAQYLAEAALFALAMGIFRALPLDTASALGGWLMRIIGRRAGFAKVARKNLSFAFPEKSEEERKVILIGFWDHLGRVAAEFAHLPGYGLYGRVSVKGVEHLPPREQPVLFVSGHFGNWELSYPIAHEYGVPVTLIYRHANNPYVDRMIAKRRATHARNMFPKGNRGAVSMARALKRGESLALLYDQKMNEGIPVPFFGKPAMTAPALAQLALKFDMPIIPARVVRMGGAHFTAQIYPPLVVEKTGDEQKDVLSILTQLNALLEGWIREHPEQWLWVHRRFGKEEYR